MEGVDHVDVKSWTIDGAERVTNVKIRAKRKAKLDHLFEMVHGSLKPHFQSMSYLTVEINKDK